MRLRDLLGGQAAGSELELALAWLAGIMLISGVLANAIYLRMAR